MEKYPSKLEKLNACLVLIYELGLDDLMAKNVTAGRSSFTGGLAAAVDGADAVGTPTRRGDGQADLTYVMAAAEMMQAIYRPLYLREFPVMTMNLESAEMIKYAASAFLATKITFINEIAALCERPGADVKQVSKGMGLHGQIGNKFLHAGPGYGGSCFPKDTSALARIDQELGVPMQLTETAIKVNGEVKRRMIDKIVDLCDGSVNGKTIAVLGVTFKPNTDDMRDAPALTIVPALVGNGAKVRVVDPQARREGEALLPGVTWEEDTYTAAKGANAAVILIQWNEFRALDLKLLAVGMAQPAMADLRNIYDEVSARASEFKAYGTVGR